MTTPDQNTGNAPTFAAPEAAPAAQPGPTGTETFAAPEAAPAAQPGPTGTETAPASREARGKVDESATPETAQTRPAADVEPTPDESLFGENGRTGLRSRWDDVQAAFVDDPQQCVQQADALVSEVVEQLTSRLSEARSRLEEQWARGEQASTEDLRLALQRYREFFHRLLSV